MLLLKFIGYFPDHLSALSRTLLCFFGQPLSKQLYTDYSGIQANVHYARLQSSQGKNTQPFLVNLKKKTASQNYSL